MNKPFWISLSLCAAFATAGTVALNDTPGMARERGKSLAAASPGEAKDPVVVEFFTSQGCSSCPPSDRLAAKLAADRSVLVIQRPVTYWDRLGWADTLGKEANSALQRAYASRSLGGRNGVYTPQAVIAGRTGLVGSNEAAIRSEIAKAQKADGPSIGLSRTADGRTEALIDSRSARDARVVLVGLDSSEAVVVSRGENGGRTLRYTNIWKGETQLGTVGRGKASFMIGPSARRIAGADRYAVIVREGTAGPVVAGAMLP